MSDKLTNFIIESNRIEGISRYKESEVKNARWFLDLPSIEIRELNLLQGAFAPNKPLRSEVGMNVQVGNHIATPGGLAIPKLLKGILYHINTNVWDPWTAYLKFETLHPYMDGNGRTGRILWAWHMQSIGENPFLRPFLHTWYYQTLEHLAK